MARNSDSNDSGGGGLVLLLLVLFMGPCMCAPAAGPATVIIIRR